MSSYNLGKMAGMQRFLGAKVTRIHRETIPSSAFLFGRTVRGSSVDLVCFQVSFYIRTPFLTEPKTLKSRWHCTFSSSGKTKQIALLSQINYSCGVRTVLSSVYTPGYGRIPFPSDILSHHLFFSDPGMPALFKCYICHYLKC